MFKPVSLLTGVLLCAGFGFAHATTGVCPTGEDCTVDPLQPFDYSVQRAAELTEQDLSAFSGVGMVACASDAGIQTSTAFLVGAFDIGVTVAHTFENGTDCVYTSIDSVGQVRERIPVSYVKSQWEAEAGAFGQPAKDVAVFRLSQPSRYAQKTMPLGRFSGVEAPVIMVGHRADIGWSTSKRKARGMAYERSTEGLNLARFTHDMDSRGIAPGAPVIDERTGVIIGIHTRLPSRGNSIITMNDWLESTLRTEIQLKKEADSG